MKRFDKYSLPVRKKIALMITAGVALLLVIIMVGKYTTQKDRGGNDSGSKLKNFYTTILDSGQSYFGGK